MNNCCNKCKYYKNFLCKLNQQIITRPDIHICDDFYDHNLPFKRRKKNYKPKIKIKKKNN